VFALAVAHLLLAGTDAARPWLVGVVLVALAAPAGLVAVRLRARFAA
jgi:hypothetical protein